MTYMCESCSKSGSCASYTTQVNKKRKRDRYNVFSNPCLDYKARKVNPFGLMLLNYMKFVNNHRAGVIIAFVLLSAMTYLAISGLLV